MTIGDKRIKLSYPAYDEVKYVTWMIEVEER